MQWNNKALALVLIAAPAVAIAQDKAPPLPEGVQATGPAGTSGTVKSYDDVGYAAIGADASGAISAASPALAAGSFAEVTAIDSGKTILVAIGGTAPVAVGHVLTLSPGAAQLLGVSGDRAAVRVRQVDPPAVDVAALRAGHPASVRMDAPPVLLTGLRTMLDAKKIAPPAIAVAPVAKPPTDKPPVPKPSIPKPAAVAKPVPPVVKPSTPTPASKPAVAAATGRYQVQVATFSTRDRAAGVARTLGGTVQPAGRYFRVRLGPYETRAAATSARDGAAKRGYGDARVLTD
ncbi:SPOR domain-containing protein [Hephaestia sp. GCM10023244]|uniref:SPOR domain-containing protein n=1 Tax=unclassified Hephaestia TaxID=2631281 RepID=UPI0020776089|nr:SPOR domain-containing protein [Hephaestia sp. MAHUQ-44]MCM8731418.1 SPOR domain-containing protein [Hephaestia sp. MAHUQ-44]